MLRRLLALRDYPGKIKRRGHAELGRRRKPFCVGWVTSDSFRGPTKYFDQLIPFTRMRTGNVAEWLNENSELFHNELYHPERHYDIVVFQKMMDQHCQAEVQRIHAYGGKIIFDANVNYYEIWGEYDILGTKPTRQQQQEAIWMTRYADWVVADSSYITDIARKFNPRVTWIPDNVDLTVYRGVKQHRPGNPVVLIWSGMAHKAQHLFLIRAVLEELKGVELVLVSNERPEAMHDLQQAIPCRYIPFSDQRYARALLESDVIISPKRLCNGYVMGHTEYKIALGMAVGLPAVASPQPSYVEAISHNGGGIIAEIDQEWFEALSEVAGNSRKRSEIGRQARRTVLECYSTPVVAEKYLAVLEQVLEIDVSSK